MARKYEEYARVLDYLPQGTPRPDGTTTKLDTAQAIGEDYFVLMEFTLKEPVKIGQKVFVGKGERKEVFQVTRLLKYEDLTTVSKANLPDVVRKIVEEHEERYVKFFNEAGAITIRLHTLQLLPGIGRARIRKILDEREKKPFESFEDIKKRTGLPDPAGVIVERIISELKREDRFRLFTGKRKMW